MVVPARLRGACSSSAPAVTAYEKLGAVTAARSRTGPGARAGRARGAAARPPRSTAHACAYREYLTDDAHLVLANLRSAAGLGAAVLNHAPVVGDHAGRRRARRASRGALPAERARVRVRARCVINAAGPWVEAVRRLESPDAPPLLHLSKGVHVVVPAERLPRAQPPGARTRNDRRSIFAIRRGERGVLGTTDTSYAAGPTCGRRSRARTSSTCWSSARAIFAAQKLGVGDVVGAWAGLRPLIAEPGKTPTEISRRDEVLVGPAGVITIAGGKLTGYRPIARETVELAASRRLAAARAGAGRGAAASRRRLRRRSRRARSRAGAGDRNQRDRGGRLARLHGSEAREVIRAGTEELVPGRARGRDRLRGPQGGRRQPGGPALPAAAHVAVRRRPRARRPCQPAAERMARLLGWDAARTQTEMRAVRAQLAADLAFRDEAPADVARAAGVK